MASIPVTRASFAEWDRVAFVSLLGGIIALWMAVQAFILLPSKGITVELVQVTLVPIVVGLLAYVYTYPTASIPELGFVAFWGVFAQRIASYGWYLTLGSAGEISISAALLSGTAQSRLMVLLRFLALALVFAGFYAAAGSRRDRSLTSALILLAVPFVLLIIHVIV